VDSNHRPADYEFSAGSRILRNLSGSESRGCRWLQIAATGCIPGASDVEPRPRINNKAADPVQESAATIAAAGMPPEPHERDAAIVTPQHALGHRADRMARYKVIRHRGTARTLRGARSERDARLRQAEGTGLSYSVTDRTRGATSQPARAVRGRPRLEQRVKASHIEGTFRRALRRGLVRAGERDRSSRGSPHAPDRTPTVRPDSRDFGPLPGPARGC
jgi:hypothetical protein